MSKSKEMSPDAEADRKQQLKSRGTQDELEILKLVVSSNPQLLTRVLNRIREIRAASKENIFDSVNRGKDE